MDQHDKTGCPYFHFFFFLVLANLRKSVGIQIKI